MTPLEIEIAKRLKDQRPVRFTDGSIPHEARPAVLMGWIVPDRMTITLQPLPAGSMPDPKLPTVFIDAVIENGRPVVDRLEIRRHGGGKPISVKHLRALPLRSILAEAWAGWRVGWREAADGSLHYEPEQPSDCDEDGLWVIRQFDAVADRERFEDEVRALSKGWPGRREDRYKPTLEEVADIYKNAPRSKPTQAVKDHYPHWSYPTVVRWVRSARDAGLLEGVQANNGPRRVTKSESLVAEHPETAKARAAANGS